MRIPTLDGWRGIAILLVIAGHWQAGMWGHPYHGWGFLITGGHGVAIFFVLSGYLITSRLFHEADLKRFYVRRIFRLWPVAWVYLGLLAIAGLLWKPEALACLLFYRNFVYFPPKPERYLTGHFWTLSIEEQFYLVWPAVMFLRRTWVTPALAVGVFGALGAWPYAGLSIGCLLAFAAREDAFCRLIKRHHTWLFPCALFGVAWCVAAYHADIPLPEMFAIAIMLACASLNGYRWLEWKLLAEIGVYSYSLYVWQEIFLVTRSGGIGILFLPVAAVASHHLIERPGIRLGARLLSKRVQRSPELEVATAE